MAQDSIISPYSLESIMQMLMQRRAAGQTVSDTDVRNAFQGALQANAATALQQRSLSQQLSEFQQNLTLNQQKFGLEKKQYSQQELASMVAGIFGAGRFGMGTADWLFPGNKDTGQASAGAAAGKWLKNLFGGGGGGNLATPTNTPNAGAWDTAFAGGDTGSATPANVAAVGSRGFGGGMPQAYFPNAAYSQVSNFAPQQAYTPPSYMPAFTPQDMSLLNFGAGTPAAVPQTPQVDWSSFFNNFGGGGVPSGGGGL